MSQQTKSASYVPPHRRQKTQDQVKDVENDKNDRDQNTYIEEHKNIIPTSTSIFKYLKCKCRRLRCICCRVRRNDPTDTPQIVSAFVFAKSIKSLKDICSVYNSRAPSYGEYCHLVRAKNKVVAYRLAYITKTDMFGDIKTLIDLDALLATNDYAKTIFANIVHTVSKQLPNLFDEIRFQEIFGDFKVPPAFTPGWVFFGKTRDYKKYDVIKKESYKYACTVSHPNDECLRWIYKMLSITDGMIVQITPPHGAWKKYTPMKYVRSVEIRITSLANGHIKIDESIVDAAARETYEETGVPLQYTEANIKIGRCNVAYTMIE
jgi:hypothetical protein